MRNLIDGRAIAEKVYVDLRTQMAELKSKGVTPGLAVVLVGDNPASRTYVRSKDKMSRELGLHSVKLELPASTTQSELLSRVDELNRDSKVHGILVQSPPPKQINEAAIVRALDPRKDVDGFHPLNVAKLAMGDPTGFVPCTPLGVQEITCSADILIAAIGRAHFVKAEHVREDAVVIDVGINRVDDKSNERGYRLVGDVAFDEVAPKASAITPVPGGVGPMTIAMLMSNTVKAARQIL